MERPRKILGRRIKAARRAAGYKSARAFAAAIGVSESSVATAEIGSHRVGMGVLMDIETGLEWPRGSIERFLESGDLAELPSHVVGRADEKLVQPRDSFEREIMDSNLDLESKVHWIRRHRISLEEEATLHEMGRGHPKRAKPRNSMNSDS